MKKKVTIKPFLNKTLSGIESNFGVKKHPLYYQITYNRKNTQFKSNFDIYVSELEDTTSTESTYIQIEIEVINKIFLQYYLSSDKTFSMIGFKQKHSFYLSSVESIIQKYLYISLQRAIVQSNSDYQNILKIENNESQILLLYKACKELIENFSKYLPEDFKFEIDTLKALSKHQKKNFLVFQWFDSNFNQDLKQDFTDYFGNIKSAENGIKLIDKILNQQLLFI